MGLLIRNNIKFLLFLLLVQYADCLYAEKAPLFQLRAKGDEIILIWNDDKVHHKITLVYKSGLEIKLFEQFFKAMEKKTIPATIFNHPVSLVAAYSYGEKWHRNFYLVREFTGIDDLYCPGMPAQTPQRKKTTCILSLGVFPNVDQDQSGVIEEALTEARKKDRALYFPAGRYKISRNLLMQDGDSLMGDPDGLSILDASQSHQTVIVGNENYYDEIHEESISNIVFENAAVRFYGRKHDIVLEGNVFFNTNRREEQLYVSHNNFLIKDNAFLRSKMFPGMTLFSYKNSNIRVESNFWGDLSDISRAKNILSTNARKRLALLNYLQDSQGRFLEDAQSNYVKGWYSSLVRHGEMINNFSASSASDKLFNPETEVEDIDRDHNIYHIAYEYLLVTGNYFSGWPKDAYGGLKFRNAGTLYFAGNYLDEINLLTYTYASSVKKLDSTFVLSNLFIESGVRYWQDYEDSEEMKLDINIFLVNRNHFISETDDVSVKGTWRTESKSRFQLAPHKSWPSLTPVKSSYFTEVTQESADQKIPEEHSYLLSLDFPDVEARTLLGAQ